MSLINQVLQDLERRQSGRPLARSFTDNMRPLPAGRSLPPAIAATLAGLLVGAFAASAVWWVTLGPAAVPGAQSGPALSHTRTEPHAVAADHAIGNQAGNVDAGVGAAIEAAAPTLTPRLARAAPAKTDGFVHAHASPTVRPLRSVAAPPSVVRLATPNDPAADPEQAVAEEAQPIPEHGLTDSSKRIDKQQRTPPLEKRADAEFRRGMALLQEGRSADAERAFRSALSIDPTAEAPRQALLGLLLEASRRDDAETLLREALQANARQPKFAMILARLQFDRGALDQAIATLGASLSDTQPNPELLAMNGAVLSRAARYADAAQMYQAALRIGPNNALWHIGLGAALKADGRAPDALAAFQRAHQLGTLTPELKAYVEQQLSELR